MSQFEHWKKLDHVVFLLMGVPIIGGIIWNLISPLDATHNIGLFSMVLILWLAVMAIDQLEEREGVRKDE